MEQPLPSDQVPARFQTPFVGRSELVAELRQSLRGGLEVLVGPPGVGKTRLAIEVCEQEWGPPGERWRFIDLTGVNDAAGVIGKLQEAFGVAPIDAPVPREALRRLASGLGRRGLEGLVLDNYEGAVAAAGWVPGELSAEARNISILVTSRRSLPDSRAHHGDVGGLTPSEGVELFCERSKRVGAREHDLLDVERLVERLDGLPLAIELAAGRARVLSARDLLRRQKPADLCAMEHPSSEHPYPSLTEAINASWESLSDELQRTLVMVSAFQGGFTLEAAECVIGPEAATLLQELQERSLLASRAMGGSRRFHFLSSIADFVNARAPSSDTRRAGAERRHAKYFARLASELGHEIKHGDTVVALRRLMPEMENLAIALHRTVLWGSAMAAELALAIDTVHRMRKPPSERWSQLNTAVEVAEEQALPSLLVEALGRRAYVHACCGQRQPALRDVSDAMAAATNWSERRSAAESCLAVATRFFEAPEVTALVQALRVEGLRRGDPLAIAAAARAQSFSALSQGDITQAIAHLERAIEVFSEEGMIFDVRQLQVKLAVALRFAGNAALAEEHALLGLSFFEAIEHRRLQGFALLALGVARLEQPEKASQALRALEQALLIYEEFGDRRSAASARYYLGLGHLNRGSYAEAEDCFLAARLEVFLCAPWAGVGAARARRGLLREAEEAFREAEASLEDPENNRGNAEWRHVYSAHRLALEFAKAESALARGERGTSEALLSRVLVGETPAITKPFTQGVREDAVFLAARHGIPVAASLDGLVVGIGGTWARLPDGQLVDLRRRGPGKRILAALCDVGPTRASLTTADLFAVGWPNEQASPQAAANRVRVALADLRRRGLRDVLERRDGGYRLRADIPLHVERTEAERAQS